MTETYLGSESLSLSSVSRYTPPASSAFLLFPPARRLLPPVKVESSLSVRHLMLLLAPSQAPRVAAVPRADPLFAAHLCQPPTLLWRQKPSCAFLRRAVKFNRPQRTETCSRFFVDIGRRFVTCILKGSSTVMIVLPAPRELPPLPNPVMSASG